jgi:hypothetical protein
MGIWQGFWLFFNSPVHAWWLSISAIFLNASWSLHNVIAWMKLRPFLSRPVSWIFIGTVILAQPYWVLEIYANFTFFHGINDLFVKTRPWEALCRYVSSSRTLTALTVIRDPWWIFTTVALFYTIKKQYELTLRDIIRISPRFGIMLLAMILSIIFIVLDICSVTEAFKSTLPVGINPFWKLAFVFKCLTDSVVLDDFKTALDRLRAFKISRIGSFSQDTSDRRTHNDGTLAKTWEDMEKEARKRPAAPAMPSPDGALVHSSHFPGFSLRKHKEPSVEHKEHKDSVASHDFGDPEDIVPSALVDPHMRTMENAHFKNALRRSNSRDEVHLEEEIDYAQALRDVEGQSLRHSSSKKSRRSLTP